MNNHYMMKMILYMMLVYMLALEQDEVQVLA